MFSPFLYQFISLDVPPLLTAMFASMSCALLGNFLVLRRLSLMGDAISHAVLPGIVLAFLISGSRVGFAVFAGAALAGILTAVLIEAVRSFGKLESGASMGVVFSIMFAAGVLMIEQAAARNIDLDADCILHGQLETIFWFPPEKIGSLFTLQTLFLLPGEVISSALIFLGCLGFIVLFFKELSVSSFDPALATSLGFNANFMHYLLMIFMAAAVVASFEAVGSILVIAMIICPAATARLYTDRLKTQIYISLIVVISSVFIGYISAAFAPLWFGYEHSLNAAGMMTVVLGGAFFVSLLFAPNYGTLSKQLRLFLLRMQVNREDILAYIYRIEESPDNASRAIDSLYNQIKKNIFLKLAFWDLQRTKDIVAKSGVLSLTEKGLAQAQSLIRSHRLWESFLVEKAGLQPDHVHPSAEKLEHFTPAELEERLAVSQSHHPTDPHGKPIP